MAGFTLIELMLVIVIISILASIATTGLQSAREKARQTSCMSNLRQIGIAIVTYRGDHAGSNPNWISNLYPAYIDDLAVYVCRSDKKRGLGPVKSEEMMKKRNDKDAYEETIDNEKSSWGRDKDGSGNNQTSLVEANSYMYEFSCRSAPSVWYKGKENEIGVSNPTWAQYKEYELRQGNDGKPFSSSKMPIVRCFHHAEYSVIDAYNKSNSGDLDKSTKIKSGLTINVAYAGNVTIAPLWWQATIEIGDK